MNERGKQAEDEIHKRLTNKEKTLLNENQDPLPSYA